MESKGAKIITMKSERVRYPADMPFSLGKMAQLADGSIQAWFSGQLGTDTNGNLVQGEDAVVTQAEQALTNIKNLAEDNGLDL